MNEVLERDTAIGPFWGAEGYFVSRSMDVYISKLRKLLAGDPGVEIRNVHGRASSSSYAEPRRVRRAPSPPARNWTAPSGSRTTVPAPTSARRRARLVPKDLDGTLLQSCVAGYPEIWSIRWWTSARGRVGQSVRPLILMGGEDYGYRIIQRVKTCPAARWSGRTRCCIRSSTACRRTGFSSPVGGSPKKAGSAILRHHGEGTPGARRERRQWRSVAGALAKLWKPLPSLD